MREGFAILQGCKFAFFVVLDKVSLWIYPFVYHLDVDLSQKSAYEISQEAAFP